MLVPTQDGFRATVEQICGSAPSKTTTRAIGCALWSPMSSGHTLFYRPDLPPTRAIPPDREEEQFCHYFANALLIPPRVAAVTPVNPDGIFRLAGYFDVSRQVAAWAVARARTPISVLWLQREPHPVRGGQETMRVAWSASHKFIPQGESFKSPLAELMPGQYGETIERLRLAGREEMTHVEAWRFQHAMLAVIRPAEEHEAADHPGDRERLFY
jgi:hypothetical protein